MRHSSVYRRVAAFVRAGVLPRRTLRAVIRSEDAYRAAKRPDRIRRMRSAYGRRTR